VLRILLDEHISPRVARQVLRRNSQVPIISISGWENGVHLSDTDEEVLLSANKQGLTLVTYDKRSIVPLLKSWAEQGIDHGGVVFIDQHTLAADDFGGLVRALCELWEAESRRKWTNRIVFLTRSRVD
jgi:hypothetical protein